jgi:YHS domain-containing protein
MKLRLTQLRLLSVFTATAFTVAMTASDSLGQSGSRSYGTRSYGARSSQPTNSPAMNRVTPSNGSGTKSNSMMKEHSSVATKLGLDGYCPVCVVMKKVWEKGSPNISSTFDGVTYYFPGENIKAMFDASPEKFVPALNGDCIVCYEKAGKRIPGTVQHPVLHKNRLYLFPSASEKDAFKAAPRSFENTDLAVNGECIVCLVKMGKHMPGSTDFTVIHNGLRYLFPSDNEANVFRNSPEEFTSKLKMMDKMGKKSMSNGVRLVGRSGCAACEFGVTPLASPDELGLAVVGKDGSVTVIEDAHQNYPQIYEDRFQNKKLAVEGKILKTQGNISWLKPSSLTVIN